MMSVCIVHCRLLRLLGLEAIWITVKLFRLLKSACRLQNVPDVKSFGWYDNTFMSMTTIYGHAINYLFIVWNVSCIVM